MTIISNVIQRLPQYVRVYSCNHRRKWLLVVLPKTVTELYGHQHHHHQQNGSESSYTLYPEPLLPASSNTTAVSTLSNEVNDDSGQTSSSVQMQQQQSYANSGNVTLSTFLTQLSSPTSDWPHYITTPTSAASPPRRS